jgi:hypothetical protein
VKSSIVADEIMEGLTELADALEAGDDDLGKRFHCRQIVSDLQPESACWGFMLFRHDSDSKNKTRNEK